MRKFLVLRILGQYIYVYIYKSITFLYVRSTYLKKLNRIKVLLLIENLYYGLLYTAT